MVFLSALFLNPVGTLSHEDEKRDDIKLPFKLVSLPQAYRLLKKDLKNKGRKLAVYNKNIRLLYKKNGLTRSRFSVLIPAKAIAKATRRNRVRRILKNALRLNIHTISPGYDIIIMIKNDQPKRDNKIVSDVIDILKETGLIKITKQT